MIDLSKFATKKELFAHLIANKEEIISLKKSALKNSDALIFSANEELTIKASSDLGEDDPAAGVIKRTIVLNTYNWMDSHGDVHMKGIFSKSISENKNIVHLHDHIHQITAKVGTPLKVYESELKWNELGIPKTGRTTVLLMDSEIKRSYNQLVYEEYLANKINQHSVGMRYVKLFLCIDDEDYKEEYANWNTYILNVANKDKAEENGYFWAVTEAKLIEGSCVIAGSNELTPTLENKFTPKEEPDNTTPIEEPSEAEKIAALKEQSKRQLILTMLG